MSQVVIVLLVIVGMSVAFFSEIIPIPATALLVPMVLQLTGVLSFNEAFAGFSSSTVVSLFTLSILAGILKQTTFLTDLQGFVTKNLVTHKNGKRYVLLAAH